MMTECNYAIWLDRTLYRCTNEHDEDGSHFVKYGDTRVRISFENPVFEACAEPTTCGRGHKKWGGKKWHMRKRADLWCEQFGSPLHELCHSTFFAGEISNLPFPCLLNKGHLGMHRSARKNEPARFIWAR